MQPQRKIAQLRLGIGELEQRIGTLVQAQQQLEDRDLTGLQVLHSCYGPGEVTGRQGRLFTVAFEREQKQFLYPDAFRQAYLTTPNGEICREVAQHQHLQTQIASMQSSITQAQKHIARLTGR